MVEVDTGTVVVEGRTVVVGAGGRVVVGDRTVELVELVDELDDGTLEVGEVSEVPPAPVLT